MSFRGNKVPSSFPSRGFKEAPINHFLQPRGSGERGCSPEKGPPSPPPRLSTPLPGAESHCPLPSMWLFDQEVSPARQYLGFV